MSYIGSTPTTQSFIAGTDYFNGTGAQVAFTLSRAVNSVNDIEVIVNNVEQIPSGYTVSGTTLTFSVAPSAGTSNVYVRYLSTTLQTIGVAAGSTQAINITGNAATATTATNVTGTVAVANGGTGQTTRQNAMDALAGAVTSGQYLRGNGTDVVMAAIVAADVPTLNQSTTGSAATLTTGRTIAITGDLTYTSDSFNGSANVTGTGTLANSGVAAGSYTLSSITVDAKGRVTAASSGSSSAPTTAQVLSATAGASAGAVGSYAFLARVANKASSAAGTTVAGGDLRYSNAYSNNDQANEGSNSVSPSGTWMIMGNTGYLNQGTANTADGFMMTLFLRIS